ncbi:MULTISPECIES: DeoR/GlpR family DNA-binding transcription regulator [Corynebacterium]|uniref:DeoR/GlpR family DNA-binding transcription regulator n=1 Tax=Corynebacterium TaxID=1716 RepID=UPI00124C8A8B|nr:MULTISPECIES: DeoR/GlpR family DNA-binding transcription regulator [Corynebacterium]
MLSVHQRRGEISSLTNTQGHSSVAELATRFNVTPETIRRDLKQLENAGLLQRVHGGAVVHQSGQQSRRSYAAAELERSREKRTIGELAATLIPDGPAAIFMDAGTSTNTLASVMAERYSEQSWTIVTNSLSIGITLAAAGVPGVNLVGGTMRAFTRSVIGEQAVDTISALRADIAIMGTNGLSEAHGLSTPDPSEAAIKRMMVQNASTVIALCDSSKFGQDYMVTFADMSDVDYVVTDENVDSHYRDTLEAHGIEVVHP